MTKTAQPTARKPEGERLNIARVHTKASIEQVEAELRQMKEAPRQIKFSEQLESEYKVHLNNEYIKSESKLLIGGHLLYFSFLWVDLFIFPDKAMPLLVIRTISAVIGMWLLYMAMFSNHQAFNSRAILATVGSGVLGGGAILLSSTLLPNPYNLMYMIGTLPLCTFITAVMRNSTRNVMLLCGAYTLMFFAAAIYNMTFGKKHDIEFVQQLMWMAAPMISFFFGAICLIAVYLTFSIERNYRYQFLYMLLRDLEADRLEVLTQRFRNLSHIDDLTRISNRRQLVSRVSEYLQDTQNHGKSAALIMMDVDHFKAYNDYYGHLQGDVCLQTLAYCLADNCQRLGDIAARYGGEEFVAFLPQTSEEQAMIVAHRIRESIMRLKLPHVHGVNGQVSASFGVASFVVDKTTSFENIAQKADVALYQAKLHHRNEVIAFDANNPEHAAKLLG